MSTNTKTSKQSTEETDFPLGARVSLEVWTGLTPEQEEIVGEIVDTEPPVIGSDEGNKYEIRGKMVELDGETVGWLALGRVLKNSWSGENHD